MVFIGPILYSQVPTSTLPEFLQNVDQDSLRGASRSFDDPNEERALTKKGPLETFEYGSSDTNYLHLERQEIELFGDAFIKYKEYDINADYILLNLAKNEVTAQYGYEGFEGKVKPSVDFQGQQVTAKKLKFNFDTQNGIVYDAIVQQGEMFVHGATTKFVTTKKDGFQLSDQIIYNKNSLISTCNHEEPHWGIRSTKLKLVPEEVAVIGPSRLELAGIPVPAFIPFAFAPLFDFSSASSGLIFPTDPFVIDPNLGIGMRGLGYYFALSDRMDLKVSGDFYTRGSWAFRTNGRYYKRYKYRGSFGMEFSRQLLETQGEIERNKQDSYSFNLTHNQDAKAHPYRTIGGSLRFTVNDYDRRNIADAQAQINGAISSNFSYSYRLSPKVNFSSSITHSQNTQTRDISFTLPDVQLRVSRISPFDNPNTTGQNDKWFEKIGLEYTTRMQNSFTTKDTLLFTAETLDLISPGITHNARASASYNLLKYFSFNTNIDYDEWWYFKTVEKKFDAIPDPDTLGTYDISLVNELTPGLQSYRDLNLSAGVSTSLYNTISRGKGWFRGFRHTVRPSVNLTYSPSTEKYEKFILEDPFDPASDTLTYNPFMSQRSSTTTGLNDAVLFRSSPSLNQGGLGVSYSIQNLFEAKVYSKKDSTEKKVKLLNNLNFTGNYNFKADSLNWSEMRYSGSIRLFNNITTINLRGTIDMYVENDDRRIARTVWQNRKLRGKIPVPFRFEDFSVDISTQMSLSQLRDLFLSEEKKLANQRRDASSRNQEDELFDWFANFRLRHILSYRIDQEDGINNGEIRTHSITLTTGRIDLSDNWGFGINNLSYDFIRKNFPIPQFSVFRDLHCWEMNFTWSPTNDVFTFAIGVKAAPFNQYLKYEAGRQIVGRRPF